MARARRNTRRTARSNPRGVLDLQPGGFGFVKTAEGDFFIPGAKLAGACGGDLVEVAPLPSGGARSGRGGRGGRDGRDGRGVAGNPHGAPAARVVRVVDRAHDVVVGRYEVAEPFGVVVPEDANIPFDVFTLRAERPDIEHGSLVRVRVTNFPSRNTAATGVVEEVFGPADAQRVGSELVIARHKLETTFSDAAVAEARAAALDEGAALAEGYRDLRERFVFTIDPEDARDFDDAISLEPVGPRTPGGRGPGGSVAQTVLAARESPLDSPEPCGTRFVSPPDPSRPTGFADGFERTPREDDGTGACSDWGSSGVACGTRFVDPSDPLGREASRGARADGLERTPREDDGTGSCSDQGSSGVACGTRFVSPPDPSRRACAGRRARARSRRRSHGRPRGRW